MICPYCKRFPCICHAVHVRSQDLRPRQAVVQRMPYSPQCLTCGHPHGSCPCRRGMCPMCRRRVCPHSNLKGRTSQLLNLNINKLYVNLSSDMQEARNQMSPKDQKKMDDALEELRDAIQKLYRMPEDQRKKLIKQAHVLASELEERRAVEAAQQAQHVQKPEKEGYVPYWMISKRRFIMPRRFWGWRRYLNPYMWYYYRPYYW